jgi:hypothetical protein
MPFTAQTFMKRSVCRKCTLGLHGVTFGEALRVWTRVALLSFGGSACVIQAMAKPPANLLGSWSRPSAASASGSRDHRDGLPENVVLTPVPDYDYQYAYINNVPVLVDPSTRRVQYLYR